MRIKAGGTKRYLEEVIERIAKKYNLGMDQEGEFYDLVFKSLFNPVKVPDSLKKPFKEANNLIKKQVHSSPVDAKSMSEQIISRLKSGEALDKITKEVMNLRPTLQSFVMNAVKDKLPKLADSMSKIMSMPPSIYLTEAQRTLKNRGLTSYAKEVEQALFTTLTYAQAASAVGDVIVGLKGRDLSSYITEIRAATEIKKEKVFPCRECMIEPGLCDQNHLRDAIKNKQCGDFFGATHALTYAYIIDALLFLRDKYEDKEAGTAFLSMAPNRNLNHLAIETLEDLDEALETYLPIKLKAIGLYNSTVKQAIKKCLSISIGTSAGVEKRWSKKFAHVLKLVRTIKTRLKDVINEPLILKTIKHYERGSDESLNIIGKYRKFKIETRLGYICRQALRALSKKDPDKLRKGMELLDVKDQEHIKELTTKSKTKRSSKEEKTPKTHPEWFTKPEDGSKPLWKPIKKGTKRLIYNKDWEKEKTRDTTWYAQGEDPETGAWVTFYTMDKMDNAKAKKFVNNAKLSPEIPRLKKVIDKALTSKDRREKTLALIVHLVWEGKIFRIGNTKSEVDDVRGLHNLQVKHLKFGPKNTLFFKWTDKKLKAQNLKLTVPPTIYKSLQEITHNKTGEEYLFAIDGHKPSPNDVNEYLREIDCPVTIHKFRTYNATKLAFELLLENPKINKSSSQKAKKEYLKSVLEEVKEAIGHDSWQTTLKYYIDPSVIEEYNKKFKVDAMVQAGLTEVLRKPINITLNLQDRKEEEEKDQDFEAWIDFMTPKIMEKNDPSVRKPL